MKKFTLILIAVMATITMQASNILVTYFSWSGNTQALANEIASQTGADVYRIQPATPYTTNYNTLAYSISNAEKDNNARPALSETDKDFSQYDYIFVGCPVWWYDAPMIIHTFLENYDFRGKTIIPFCTYATSDYQTLNDIVNATPGSDHFEGLGVRGSSSYNSNTVHNWLERIGITKIVAAVEDVRIDNPKNHNIYRLDGTLAGRDISALSAGIYVTNGRKIVVR